MSGKETEKKGPSAGDYRIPASAPWAGAWRIAAGVGVLGLGGAAAGYSIDPKRFAFSYLFAFFLVLTLAFGSMFFVLIERLTAASWSVSVRRTAEFFASSVPVFILLFLPVLASRTTLYPWLSGHAESGIVESNAHAQEPPAVGQEPPAGHGGRPGARPGLPPIGAHGPGDRAAAEQGRSHAEHGAKETPEEAAETAVIAGKAPWLNQKGWIIRACIYFAVRTERRIRSSRSARSSSPRRRRSSSPSP